MSSQQGRQASQLPRADRPPYRAPQVTNLGPWAQLTLAYSVPIVPPTGGPQ